jgi:hypothetical protein
MVVMSNAAPAAASPAPLRRVLRREPVAGSRSAASEVLACGHRIATGLYSRPVPYVHCTQCLVESILRGEASIPANDGTRPRFPCGNCFGRATVDGQDCGDCLGTGSRAYALAARLRGEISELSKLLAGAIERADMRWVEAIFYRRARHERALARVLRMVQPPSEPPTPPSSPRLTKQWTCAPCGKGMTTTELADGSEGRTYEVQCGCGRRMRMVQS